MALSANVRQLIRQIAYGRQLGRRLHSRGFVLGLLLIAPVWATQRPAAAPTQTPAVTTVAPATVAPLLNYDSIFHPVEGSGGMVASQEALATQVGQKILQQGGNAVDAAVAVGFALSVTLPRAGNLGGGGFMLVHLAKANKTLALDYRETAPAAASRDMFLGADGRVDEQQSRFSYRASGVPGTVHGLLGALQRYGTMPRAQVLAPAIALAEQGFIVSPALAHSLASRQATFKNSAAAMRVFFHKDGSPYRAGERLRQKDLGWSLRQIAAHGEAAFYQGAIAKRIAADMEKNKGLITLQDLNAYRSIERTAVQGQYREHSIVAMPPPSSGGIHVVQILNILEGYPLHEFGHNSARYIHVLTEAMKHAYADRSQYLGDPDFVKIPQQALLSKDYAATIRSLISEQQAKASDDIRPHALADYESLETTHYSVMDKFGNAVANTYTLNFTYGSHKLVEGTGILLNNEMDDFSAKAGVANAFGLLGGDANAIAPNKRPLSSMAPVIVLKDGKVALVTGSPGGSQIITVVLQVLLNVLEHGMNLQEASNAPRIHHQWYPDVLNLEPGISPDTWALLRQRGHTLKLSTTMGSTQSIQFIDGRFYGASDPRRPDALTLAVGP